MTKEQEKAINNLKQYIKEDETYNSARENLSDFDKFCINHCTDIETVLELVKSQQKQIEGKERIIDKLIKQIEKMRKNSEEDCFISKEIMNINDCIKTTCEDCIREHFTNIERRK